MTFFCEFFWLDMLGWWFLLHSNTPMFSFLCIYQMHSNAASTLILCLKISGGLVFVLAIESKIFPHERRWQASDLQSCRKRGIKGTFSRKEKYGGWLTTLTPLCVPVKIQSSIFHKRRKASLKWRRSSGALRLWRRRCVTRWACSS